MLETLLNQGETMGEIVSKVSEIAGRRRMTIADIAREGKISYDAAKRQWYGTASRIEMSTLAALCEALGCQPGDLFLYKDSGNGDRN